jgi:hypothetical protein
MLLLLLMILTVAFGKPACVGESAALTRHVFPGPGNALSTVVFVQVVPARVNSPGFVPPRETFEMVRGPLPVFVTVTVWTGLVVPTRVGRNWGGTLKLIEFEESCRAGVSMPFPMSVML